MTLSTEEARYVAVLARLGLTDTEVETFSGQLDAVLGYVKKISELELDGVKPTTHAVALQNVLRPDIVKPSLGREEALANAPEREDNAFLVPKIV